MAHLATLKSHFAFLASSQGYISENDYHTACHGVTDDSVLNELSDWLIEKEYKLVKGVGQQYQQEVIQRIKNPNVNDVKDTKHRTHKNTDKFQKSKKTQVTPVQETASFHLNKTIEDMQEFEDEFFPAWKRWKASLDSGNEFVALLASVGLTAQDFNNYEQAQRSVMQLIDAYGNQIPEDALINNTDLQNEFLKIDPSASLPINQRITNAIAKIFDPTILADIFTELYKGIQSGFEKVDPTLEESPVEAMPSGTREIEFESGPSGLETASKKPRKVKTAKIATTVARIGYSDKEKLNIKFENGAKFLSYVAETPLQKAAGLEVFDALDTAEGLFFPFEEEGSVTFHMGSVAFPIDIVFLLESPNGLEVGKVVANIEPGAHEWWSYPKTSAVLEIAGGMCKKADIKVGSICKINTRIDAQLGGVEAPLPAEYDLSLPDYAGEHDIFELFKLLSEYHGGQGDPIYAVQSRESKDNISLDELEAIERLLEDIDNGKYMPGYPHGQLAPGDSPMGLQESEEYEEEQSSASKDMSIAESWLPVIREIISENSSEEEEEF